MSKVRAARQQKRRYPFTPNTRLFDLVSAQYHMTLATWLKSIAPYLKDGVAPDWKTAKRLDFRCRKERTAWCIALLLDKIGKEGLKYKKSVFLRYLTTSEHSNIEISEQYLTTLVNNMLRFRLLPVN